jgi:CoA:oxalate CoA-transferase
MWEVADFVGTGQIPGPLGTAHRLVAPYEAFTCGDDQPLVIGVTGRAWQDLCRVLGVDLAGDPRFDTEYSRFVHRQELAAILQARFGTASRDVWIQRLRDAGIACGPVNNIEQMLADKQYGVRGMFPSDQERFGHSRIVNTPLIADGAPRAHRRAPRVGENSVTLLTELGLSDADIQGLTQDRVIGVDEQLAPVAATAG